MSDFLQPNDIGVMKPLKSFMENDWLEWEADTTQAVYMAKSGNRKKPSYKVSFILSLLCNF
jgi:hypothetical protein